jgi:hypothetical protein
MGHRQSSILRLVVNSCCACCYLPTRQEVVTSVQQLVYVSAGVLPLDRQAALRQRLRDSLSSLEATHRDLYLRSEQCVSGVLCNTVLVAATASLLFSLLVVAVSHCRLSDTAQSDLYAIKWVLVHDVIASGSVITRTSNLLELGVEYIKKGKMILNSPLSEASTPCSSSPALHSAHYLCLIYSIRHPEWCAVSYLPCYS